MTSPSAKPGEHPRVAYWPDLETKILQSDCSFVVIGAGGWISRATLDVLHAILGDEAFERRVLIFGSSARAIPLTTTFSAQARGLADLGATPPRPAMIMHNAFLTRDKVGGLPLADYVARNREISQAVYDLCRSWRPQGVVLPSSGAAYGQDGALETDLERNPYGALKVEDERRFMALAQDQGGACVAPRIFGLAGEYINKVDIYALASIIKQVQAGGPVHLRARGPVYRSYLYVGDLISLSFNYLFGMPGRQEAFDTAGEQIVEVEELARLVVQVLDSKASIQRTLDAGVAPDRYVGRIDRIRELAGQLGGGLTPLDQQIARTAAYLAAT